MVKFEVYKTREAREPENRNCQLRSGLEDRNRREKIMKKYEYNSV